jgi:hypothetical protein
MALTTRDYLVHRRLGQRFDIPRSASAHPCRDVECEPDCRPQPQVSCPMTTTASALPLRDVDDGRPRAGCDRSTFPEDSGENCEAVVRHY